MAATSGKQHGVGIRQARLYALDERGIIDPGAASATAYEGVQIQTVKALEMTIPDVRRITHVGDDRIAAQDVLPRIEPSSGVLRVGAIDHEVHALLTGTKRRLVNGVSKVGHATDKQGSEVDIALLTFQQSLDRVARTRRYHAYAFAITRLIPVPGTMDENPMETVYNMLPQVSNKAIWGEQYTEADDGYLESEFDDWMTVGYPHIVAWKGDGIITEFNLPADKPASSVDKVAGVWIVDAAGSYGVEDATATIAVDSITPTAMPAEDDIVICVYEYTP
jgi:hypothetical protein